MQTFMQTTSALSVEAQEAMLTLTGGCEQALQQDGLYNNMLYNAQWATYYQAFGSTGQLTLSDIHYLAPGGQPWAGDPTLSTWCPATEDIACTAGEQGIIVTANFYGESTTDQQITLIHELLHYTLAAGDPNNPSAYDDEGTANFLGLNYTAGDPTSASLAITNWLTAGCPQ